MPNNSVPDPKKIACEAINRIHEDGVTPEKLIKAYDEWAERYDEELPTEVYNPSLAAEVLAEHYTDTYEPSRKDALVLDVAAGTGRVGDVLYRMGFRHIDALDPSEKMLERLKSRGVYSRIWKDTVGWHQTEIPSDFYDAVVTAGSLIDGHMPVSGVHEIVRVTKPGGIMALLIREEFLSNSEEYRKLEPLLNELEEEKKIAKMARKVVPKFSLYLDGVVFVYKKL